MGEVLSARVVEPLNFYVPDDYMLMFEPTPRRIRAIFGGETIADSKRAMLLNESMHLPVYYFPREDVRMEYLEPSQHVTESPGKGVATYWSVRVGERTAQDSAIAYDEPPEGAPDLRGYVAFDWDAMDAWFEEDDQVYKHPRDPYHRVDVLSSSRHVRVEIDGVTVAETTRPRLLFETTLPARYYIPMPDVRLDLLTPSETTTICPYKGVASYWSVTVNGKTYDDIVWGYQYPVPECPKIEGLLSFFNEKVDVYVDGEREEKAETPWTSRKPEDVDSEMGTPA